MKGWKPDVQVYMTPYENHIELVLLDRDAKCRGWKVNLLAHPCTVSVVVLLAIMIVIIL